MNTPSHANRIYWDEDAARYHDDHPAYLDGFYWCPEMLSESDARLLGDVVGKRVLEVGCGSAPCSTWLADDQPDAFVTAFDISAGMLAHSESGARGVDPGVHGSRSGSRDDDSPTVPLVQADVLALPYRSGTFDVAFSAFGALPFIRDEVAALREIRRVINDEGRFVFSVNHPMRWVFPDDPASLTAEIPYFAREYEEYDERGQLVYAEYHRTFGDWVRALRAAGFELIDVIEPQWPDDLTQNWGQWSPERGRVFPGTAIFVTRCAS